MTDNNPLFKNHNKCGWCGKKHETHEKLLRHLTKCKKRPAATGKRKPPRDGR